MSDKKMIIRNCPCYTVQEHCKYNCSGKTLSPYCQDCDSCVIKQIVELCEEESSLVQHKQRIKVKGLNKLADKIFGLLDIQEVE